MERSKFSKKNSKTKKFFEDIVNSYNQSLKDFNNLKDLHSLAHKEKDEETLKDCNKKIEQIFKNSKNEINCFYRRK